MNPLIYNIFPEIERMNILASGSGVSNTAAPVSLAGFARAGFRIPQTGSVSSPSIGPRSDVWWHFYSNPLRNNLTDGPFCRIVDSITGANILELDGDNGVFFLEVSTNGSNFVRQGATIFSGVGTATDLLEFDIHVQVLNGGDTQIDVFVGQVLVASFTGDIGPAVYADSIQFDNPIFFGSSNLDVFELVAMGTPSFGTRVASNAIEATDVPNDFAGLVSDIASADADNTATMTAGVGDEQAFILGDLSAVAGTLNPAAVFVHATAQSDGVTNGLDVGLQINGSRVTQANPLVAGGFEQVQAQFDFNNPVTGLPWTITDIDSMSAFFRGTA